ncbi:FxsA family protein [Streptosporangium sp. NBC_01756]|uniref:FxsA family protein n=1 Tax=Streptosporangium sp. NBC_01756 TaxID=2975950 RepID=UPI002DDBBBA0|nr:FxsA family protein [Streptosporangium sp. NBC_01756]WSC86998.1 FxsA family protein [Streptosporangium sp. NBC_01756]
MRLLLVLAFLAVPVLEILVFVQVGQAIGVWSAIALLAAGSLLGSMVVRREGRKAWRKLQDAMQTGRMPEPGASGGAMTIAGGVLLAVPGFLTDIVGLLFILPFTQPLMRGLGARFLARRIEKLAGKAGGPGLGSPFGDPGTPFDVIRDQRSGSGPVIHGEVIRDEPGHPPARDSSRDLTGR